MRRLLCAPDEGFHLKPIWDHLSEAVSMRSNRSTPEWPLGLFNTMQMAQQLLGRVLVPPSEIWGSGHDHDAGVALLFDAGLHWGINLDK